MENNKPIISIKNLFSIYNQNSQGYFVANKNVSYDFFRNKIYFIIGNSGSGKSTLIHHFNGLKNTKYGSCCVEGQEIGTNFDLHGFFLDFATLEELDVNVQKILEYKLHKNKHTKLYVLAFNKCTTANIARIFINIIYQYNPKHLHSWVSLTKKIKYFYFFANEELEIKDDCSWIKAEFNHGAKLPVHFTLKQKRRAKHIKNVKSIRKKVACVFQFPEYQLFKDQIIKDVIFGPINLGVKKPQALEYAKKYLKMVNIPESYYEHSPFGLSGGQKRRVAIAGILAIQSDVVVFDEPTAGLDPNGENEMLTIISNLKNQEGKTIIVISHNMDHVLEIADEVLVFNNGLLVKAGQPYDIFLNEADIIQWGLKIPHVIKTYLDVSQKINDANMKKEFDELILKNKPKNINEFTKLLTSFFYRFDKQSSPSLMNKSDPYTTNVNNEQNDCFLNEKIQGENDE